MNNQYYMSILNILKYPDRRLHTIASPVDVINDEIRLLIENMAETMYAVVGIGLAATQVNYHKQIIVIDISEGKNDLLVLINPKLLESAGCQESNEGCLSVPEIFEKVRREDSIRIKALNVQGESFELKVNGLLSVCIQHEMDHLIGKVFVEYLSPLKKTRIRKKMIKKNKQSFVQA